MRHSTGSALEGTGIGRVVEIYGEIILKAEDNSSKRVSCPTLLGYAIVAAEQLLARHMTGVERLVGGLVDDRLRAK